MKRMFVFIGIFYLLLSIQPASAGLGFLKIFIAKTHPACMKAEPAYHAKFCSSFKEAAACACKSSGLSTGMCSDMQTLHHRMLTVFTTELEACKYQRDTSVQNCLDSWSCYRSGGKDSKGRLCQATGSACA